MKKIIILILVFIFAACSSVSPNQTITPTVPAVTPSPTPGIELPPVEGPEPSAKVAAFYYPWYGNPKTDGAWIHWDQSGHRPPQDIGSDYYPALGAYSSKDPQVVAQHMAWLRQAGVGVIISSWWGQGSNENQVVPLVLQMAERYGIKVAFHIEPYSGRTAESLVNDVKYLYRKYGNSPAFFRSNTSSRNSPGDQPKGMFFVWSIEFKEFGQSPVQADYWLPAIDAIHALPEGGLIIANTLQGSWIKGGHFDGLYNYVTLHTDQNGGFSWARNLPPDSLYIPSVIPGNSARRVGYPEETYVARQDGATFNEQWTAALGTGVEPAMVTVTSFNEWHEGSMIEPPAIGTNDGKGYSYADFGALPPDGYLSLTHKWIDTYLATQWPTVYRARIKISTTSDWTTLSIVSGGAWMRPEEISASDTATNASMEAGDRFALLQSLNDANAGKQVEMIWDVLLSGLAEGQDLVLQIDRGNIGITKVIIYNYIGETPIQVGAFNWRGVTTNRNSHSINIPAADLMKPVP
jgi:glycoprotein endo-alpha-1,2-mannosidase